MTDNAPNACYADNHSTGQLWSNIEATDVQGQLLRNQIGNGPQIVDNCSFLANGEIDPSFDPGLLSPNIGLTAEWPF